MAQLLSARVVLVVDPVAGGRAVVVVGLVLVEAAVVVDVAGDVVVATMVVVVPTSVLSMIGVVVDVVDVVVEVLAAVVVLAGIVVAGGVVVVASDVAPPSPPHAAITRVPAMRSSAGVFMWRGPIERCIGEQGAWGHCRRGPRRSLSRAPVGFTRNTYKI